MSQSSRIVTEPASGAVRISLTHAELRLAFDLAIARMAVNLTRGAQHYIEGTHDGLWQHAKGAVGEIAASLYLERPLYALTSLGDYDAPDVPPNVQVRCTTKAGAPLPLYDKKDKPEHAFVLAYWAVDVDLSRVILVGWNFKRRVAREAYWDAKDQGWKVPAAELRAMAELATGFAEARAREVLAQARPQPAPPATPAPAASTLAADLAQAAAAATPASAPGEATAAGSRPIGGDISALERDF